MATAATDQIYERTISALKNDVKSGIYRGKPKTSRYSKDLAKVYKVPHFDHPYTTHLLHPLTLEYNNICHNWLASQGIDKKLGPDMWEVLVKSETPHLMGYVFPKAEPKVFLWLCKLCAWLFTVDSKMDESEWAHNPHDSCVSILDMTLVLWWHDPENKFMQEHLKPVSEEAMKTEESRAHLEGFHEDLLHAKSKSKSLTDVKLDQFASALRELWIEYLDVVPAEFVNRYAEGIQVYFTGSLWESKNRQADKEVNDLGEYFVYRRLSGGLLPFMICTDMIIAKQKGNMPQIPNSLFYGQHFQILLQAVTDVISWHNDIFSFHKEVIQADEVHNLVKIVCDQYSCPSFTSAGLVALQIVQDRLADMERVYEQLKLVASPEFHPAIEVYMETCRNWVSGTHHWHLLTTRYNVAGTSI